MSGINLRKKGRAGVAIYLYVLYLVGRTDGLLSLGSRRSSTSTAPHERATAVCSRRRVPRGGRFRNESEDGPAWEWQRPGGAHPYSGEYAHTFWCMVLV